MSLEQLSTLMGLGAAVVTTVLGVWTAARAVGRSTRLHRDEALWRQALEVTEGPQTALLKNLHRHTTAQLVALRLTPKPTPGVRLIVVLGTVLAGLAGVLGTELAATPEAPNARLAAVALAILTLGSLVFLYMALDELTLEADARNKIAKSVLSGESLDAEEVRRPRWRKVILLSFGCVIITVGLSAAVWSLTRFIGGAGTPYPLITIGAMLLYLFGMTVAPPVWRGLVQRVPEFRWTGASGKKQAPKNRSSPEPRPRTCSSVSRSKGAALLIAAALVSTRWRAVVRQGKQP